MGKKYVEFDGEKEYLSDCEPADDASMVLMESSEGCEGQYVHKFDEGRSYCKKRFYYFDLDQKQFVTPCNKSTEFLLHKIDITGYENNDVTKKAKPITTVYIEPEENNKIELKTNYIDPTTEPTPYSLFSTVDEETDSFVFSGCHKVTQTNRYKNYTRPDGTNYKEFVGIGTPRKGRNLCRTSKETKDVYHHTHVWATIATTDKPLYEFDVKDPYERKYRKVNTLRESESSVNTASSGGRSITIGYRAKHRCAKYYEIYERIITHYPDGRVSTGTWSNTHKIKKGSTYYGFHLGGGIPTPKLKEIRASSASFGEAY